MNSTEFYYSSDYCFPNKDITLREAIDLYELYRVWHDMYLDEVKTHYRDRLAQVLGGAV